MVLDTIARKLRIRFRLLSGRAVARTEYAGEPLVLVKPLMYMNESGPVVREHLLAEPDRFLVVYDDLDLPFGRLRLRPRGSAGGHKGLDSIIRHLGTTDFPRLRVGIGRPTPGQDTVDYVLERFSPTEESLLPTILDRAAACCLAVISEGLEAAMNRFNAEDASLVSQPAASAENTSPSTWRKTKNQTGMHS